MLPAATDNKLFFQADLHILISMKSLLYALLLISGSLLLCQCNQDDTPEYELVKLVADINPGRASAFTMYDFQYAANDGKFYIVAKDEELGSQIRILESDSLQISTVFIDVSGGGSASLIHAMNGEAYAAVNGSSEGDGLWKLGEGKQHRGNLKIGSAFPSPFVQLEERLYFIGQDSEHGKELRKFDGTGVALISEIGPAEQGNNASWMVGFQDEILLTAADSSYFTELYIYHSAGDSIETKELKPGPEGSFPAFYTPFRDTLFFAANHPELGRELWKYDGDALTTVDLVPGSEGSSPYYFIDHQDALYFLAKDSLHGRELWRYQQGKASRLTDIYPGPEDGMPRSDWRKSRITAAFQDNLYFMGADAEHGEELWKFDGQQATLVADIYPGESGSDPQWLTPFDGKLYFTAKDEEHGTELWQYDGEEAQLVKDIYPDQYSSTPYYLTTFGDFLFFHAEHPDYGRELWVIEAGTNTLSAQ